MAVSLYFQFAAGLDAYCWQVKRWSEGQSRTSQEPGQRFATHSEVGVDVSLDDGGDLGLKLLHQRSREVGGSLSAGVALFRSDKAIGSVQVGWTE